MPGSNTHFQEVSAQVSLTVATNNSFRDKKLRKFRFLGYFSKANNGGVRPKRSQFLQQV